MSNSRAGWYPDPSGDPSKLRFWDGEQWTNAYAESPAQQQGEPAAQTMNATTVIRTESHGMSSQDKTLRLIAFIFCALSLASWFWLLIPLAWMIPMMIRAWGIYKGTKPNTVAFGVCTLIFFSLVSGILLLVSTKEE